MSSVKFFKNFYFIYKNRKAPFRTIHPLIHCFEIFQVLQLIGISSCSGINQAALPVLKSVKGIH